MQTLQLALLEQHLEVGVQLLPPLLNKVRSRVVIEEALGRQLQSVCWHLCISKSILTKQLVPSVASRCQVCLLLGYCAGVRCWGMAHAGVHAGLQSLLCMMKYGASCRVSAAA